jgi:DNA transposition AAA+ family ATPase
MSTPHHRKNAKLHQVPASLNPAVPQNGLPPERPQAPDGALTKERMASAIDHDLRTWMLAHREQESLTNRELSAALRTSETRLSKWLNGNPDGDWLPVQARAADYRQAWLKRKGRRSAVVGIAEDCPSDARLHDFPAALMVEGVCETLRRSNLMGLLFGPPGGGKTCGCARYLRKHPQGVCITLAADRRGPEALTDALLAGAELPKAKLNWPRAKVAREFYKGTSRLIIVDNAQRISRAGIRFLCDFHDATGCPVLLIGNPRVLELALEDPALHRRIKLRKEIDFTVSTDAQGRQSDALEIAQQMIEDFDPDWVNVLLSDAAAVLQGEGRAGTLHGQLTLMVTLMELQPELTDPAEAFKQAATFMARQEALTKYQKKGRK